MKVQLSAAVQFKLNQLAAETGRPQDDFVLDAITGYFAELAQVCGLLDNRYDDLTSNRVDLVSSEQVMAHFHAKSAARRA